MARYFGTDGIRGIFGEDMNMDIALRCGNALSCKKEHTKIVIGRDTRGSGDYLTHALSCGVMMAGGDVVDMGIAPTSSVAYIARKYGYDYGVVISASHNPAKYNGIKVFDSTGHKLLDKEEYEIENLMSGPLKTRSVGRYCHKEELVGEYVEFLLSCTDKSLTGYKVVLDCANGACYDVAPKVFSSLGAEVVAINTRSDGESINSHCGATDLEDVKKSVAKFGADVGLAFDGDGDRLMAVTHDGKVLDGDILLYLFTMYLKEKRELRENVSVGTVQTNMAVEVELKRRAIGFVRTDVGDKYISRAMGDRLSIGAEQAGHIILGNLHTTGDGILSAIKLCEILCEKGRDFLSSYNFQLYPQANMSIEVKDKERIMEDENIQSLISKFSLILKDRGRVLVRPSGTERKIRIMVECLSLDEAEEMASRLSSVVREIDKGL